MKNRPMRHVGLELLLLLCFASVLQAQDPMQRALDQSIDEAAQQAAQKLKETAFQDVNNLAVLPLWGDCSAEIKQYVTRSIQDQIIGGRYRVMERSDAAWDNLLGEIEWSALREDIMNQATLQQFGRIVGCDAVVYGTIRECASDPQRNEAVTRLSLTLGVVETGEARWSSGEIKSVTFGPAAAALPVDVDPALARAVTQAAQEAAAREAEQQAQAAAQEAREAAAADVGNVFYFEFDSSSLSDEARGDVDVHIAALLGNNDSIRLEGHGDARGTREYNLALGERRANAVRDYMVANGVPSYRIETISYGEEDPEAYGSGEANWQLNRRVEIIY